MALKENTVLLQNLLDIATSLPPATSIPEFTTEEKTVTPTKNTQYITPTTASALSKVTVNPIPTEYIIPTGSKDIPENGTNINVAQYATVNVNVPIPTFTTQEKTVTPTKSSQSVTPDTGKDGLSKVTVNPIPTEYIIPSGNKSLAPSETTQSNIDVKNFATASVSAIPIETKAAITPTKSSQTVNATSGKYMKTVTVNPIPSEYIIPSGKAEIVNNGSDIDISQFATVDVNVPIPTFTTEEKTVSPSEDSQVVTPDSADGLSKVTVGAIPSTYVGSAVPRKSSTDLSASGATVTVPSGYYASQVTKSVASGSAGTPSASKGSVSNHQITITPTVTNTTGYITGGTKTGTGVTVSASELVSGSQTITQNGTGIDVTNLKTVDVNVASSGSEKNQQVHIGYNAVSTSSYTGTSQGLTCNKTGTYNVSWMGWRSTNSGTSGSQLYINGKAYGSAQTSFSNTYGQYVNLQNVSLNAGDALQLYARARSTSYVMAVGNLCIAEV